MPYGASSFVNNRVFKVLWNQGRLLQRFRLISCFWRMPCANLWRELPSWSAGQRVGGQAESKFPQFFSASVPRPAPGSEKPKRKKWANPVVNLNTWAIIGNWRRLSKWIRSWSIGRKLVPSAGVCCRRMRADQFHPWSDIRSGNCLKFVRWLPSTV
jgi:hypothetical protein